MSRPPLSAVRALLLALCGFSLGASPPQAGSARFAPRPSAAWSPQPSRGCNSYDAYHDDLFQMYTDWGVDFIRADDMLRPVYHAREIALMRRAIDKTGRLMLTGWEFAGAENLNRTKRRNERQDNFTPAERQTLMTLWCIARSPLMWGGDPLTSDEETYALLSNLSR